MIIIATTTLTPIIMITITAMLNSYNNKKGYVIIMKLATTTTTATKKKTKEKQKQNNNNNKNKTLEMTMIQK